LSVPLEGNRVQKCGGVVSKITKKMYVGEEELNSRDFKKIRVFIVRATKVDNISELDAIEIGFTTTI
jgi:hypothetical protein